MTVVWTHTLRAANAPDFDRQVAPILARRCLDCHSGPDPKGGLDLSRRSALFRGGANGEAVVPGKPDESLIWEQIADDTMPPKRPLPVAEKQVLRQWIAAGASWGGDPIDPYQATTDRRAGRDWWSLQPVRRPPLPAVQRPSWARNPIDRFVLAGLDASGLSPAAPADRRVLIRRLSFDLLGLPPSPEEVREFLQDEAPGAYERLVDRLLASPQYGVRWGRLWLDLARYGESNGFEHDEFRPDAWPYRDWVVDALNRDLPYDEFARLQLAGDVLHPEESDAIKATGFLVAGAFDSVGQNQQSEAMRKVVRQDELEDLVSTVGQTFLGLTIQCARCHDHKFDPIPQVDYFRITAALAGVRRGVRDVGPLEPESRQTMRRVAQLREELATAEAGLERSRRRSEIDALEASLKARSRKVFATTPGRPDPVHRLVRGDASQPAEVVAAGGVAAVIGPDADFGLGPEATDAERRGRLAAWITHPSNPLFSRVIVNRLWQGHFGTGLVETPSDFGFQGGVPSHPELLDWLAAELVSNAWSLKRIQRLIVTSSTYRQDSTLRPEAARIDAGNRLYWRKAPLRLDAEALRDTMLFVSGALSLRQRGPGFREFKIKHVPGSPSTLYTQAEPIGPEFDRRTIYRTWARGGRSLFLDAFDCPDPSTTTPRRAVTITPLQALALLNNELTFRLADRLGERLRREAGPDPGPQVERAYRLAFGRGPDVAERARASRVVASHGASVLARAIFNSNEFLYID